MTSDERDYIETLKIKTQDEIQDQEDVWMKTIQTIDPDAVQLQTGELLFETRINDGFNIYYGNFRDLELQPEHEFERREEAEAKWLDLVFEEYGRDNKDLNEF